jgi:chromosome segregation ATPase
MYEWILEMDTQALIAFFGLITTAITTIGGYFIWTQRARIRQIESARLNEESKRRVELDKERTERLRIDREFQEFRSQQEQSTALIHVVTTLAENVGKADLTYREGFQQVTSSVDLNTQIQNEAKKNLDRLDSHITGMSIASQDLATEFKRMTMKMDELLTELQADNGKKDNKVAECISKLDKAVERLTPVVERFEALPKPSEPTEKSDNDNKEKDIV